MGRHEVTVTLRPLLYSKTCKEQFEMTSKYMKDILRNYRSTCIAELTGEHNIHYHCIVEIEGIEMKDKFLNSFRQYNKYFGRKTCRMVQFEESYDKYLVKSYQETCKLISDPFVKDDYKIHKLLSVKYIDYQGTLSAAHRGTSAQMRAKDSETTAEKAEDRNDPFEHRELFNFLVDKKRFKDLKINIKH